MLEVLIATQLLFLNNFSEPLCKKAKQVLKTIFDKLTLVKGELIVGESIPDEATGEVTTYPLFETKEGITKQIKLNVILVSCAMLYNFCQLTVELFSEQQSSFETLCHLVKTMIPSDLSALAEGDRIPNLSSYETKLLVCGLSRVFFGKPNSIYVPVVDVSSPRQKALSRGMSDLSQGGPASSGHRSLNSKTSKELRDE